MLKKYVGGLTLLVFTFTFVVPLLIGVSTADADPTLIITQDWVTEFVCPDGTYATRSKGQHRTESYTNHPEDECEMELHRDPTHPWCFIVFGFCNDLWVEVCEHVEHETTELHNETLDYTKVTLWNNRNYCQDDDEDEETTN